MKFNSEQLIFLYREIITGKPVWIRRGPATVMGSFCHIHWGNLGRRQ